MTDVAPKRRRWWKILLVLFVIGLLGFGAIAWYATTDSFQGMVRRRLVTEIEQITGGRVELGGFHTTPFRLRMDVRDLTIHGREAAGEVPFVHLDRLIADIHVISVLSLRFGFHAVTVDHPVVHIVVYPDGTTNQPAPIVKKKSDGTPVDQFFGLRIAHLEINRGELIWNDARVPLDLAANDVSAKLHYSFLRRRYEAQLSLGKVDSRVQDCRPFAWRAQVNLMLGRDTVEFKDLTVDSGPSHLKFQGGINDFRVPVLKGSLSANLDLSDIAAIFRQRPLRRGTLDLEGSGQWSLKDFNLDGSLSARELEWRGEGLNLQSVGVTSKFSLRPQRISFSDIQIRLLGGAVAGDADISGWQEALRRNEHGPPRARRALSRAELESVPRGSARIRFSNLDLSALKRAFSSRKLPLERARFAGTATGTADLSWIDHPSDAETKFTLRLEPPRVPVRQDIPLTLDARGVYRATRDELEIAELTAATPTTSIHAEGTLASSASARLSITTRDLREWEPFLHLKDGSVPILLRGQATFNGTLSGRVHDPHIAGNLQLADFDTLLPATAHRPETQLHWDSAAADLQYSSSAVLARNVTLLRGATQIRGDLNAELHRGDFSDSSHISAHLNVQHGDIAEIIALSGSSYPVAGVIDLNAQVAGTMREPSGGGHLQLSNGVAYGQPISKFASDIRFANGEAQFTNLTVQQGAAEISGTAAYALSSRTYRLNLTGSNFELSRVERIQNERFTVAGLLSFHAQGTGTLEEPSINADVHVRDLTLNREQLGNFDAHAVTQGARLRLDGVSDFQNAQLRTSGTITLRDDYPADFKMNFSRLDIDSLLRIYLRGQVTGHSAAEGEIELHGPLRRPSDLVITANLSHVSAEIDKVTLRNEDPIRMGFSGQTVTLEQFHVVGTGTDLTAHGTAQLSGDRALDVHADGTINLTLVQTWVPDLTSSGNVSVGMNVTGVVTAPVFRGQVQITDGAFSYSDLPTGLSQTNGTLTFNENQLQVQTLTARTGGGTLNVTGAISYYRHQVLFDLKGTAQEVRLRYPPGISSTTNADLRLTGTSDSATLSGDLTVMKLTMTPGFDFGSYLERAKMTSQIPQANAPLNRLKLDLHVTTTPELQMQTAMAKLSGDADLRVRGSAARPVVLGRVDILEGEAFFNGAKYRLERGDVLFTNPVRIEPILDLEATTRVSDYDVTIGLNGTVDKLNVNYRSEPPLPSADIIALLALGRTREESASLENSSVSGLSGAASNLILSEALNATLSSRVQRLFGVSRIKIDPQGLPSATNVVRGPQVTIEQQVASNLTLTYSTSVAAATQQIIQLEYNVTRSVSIVALRDQNGVVSFDIKVRKRKK